MKRVGLILGTVFAVSLLTGCGGSAKQLECTISNESGGVSAKQVYTLNFSKKDKFESAKLVQDMKLSDSLKEYLETYKETFEETLKTNENTKGLDIKVTDNGSDTITATVTFTADDASRISGSNASAATYKAMKEALEENAYTCK